MGAVTPLEHTERLTPAPADADEVVFHAGDLAGLRGVVRRLCQRAGLTAEESDDVVLAAHEVAANSVVHGGGSGVLRAWEEPGGRTGEPGALVLQVSDDGCLVGPVPTAPAPDELLDTGRGLWIAGQLCDVVQVASTSDGTVVRLVTWL